MPAFNSNNMRSAAHIPRLTPSYTAVSVAQPSLPLCNAGRGLDLWWPSLGAS